MYGSLLNKYKEWLILYGDSPQGVGWPANKDSSIRHQVMLDIVKQHPATLLDFGCGPALFLDFIRTKNIAIDYTGMDILPEAISLARKKYPKDKFLCANIFQEHLQPYDYVIINGVFTYKGDVSFDNMWSFAQKSFTTLFSLSKIGLAINFMSKHVDWERDDLFHMPLELIVDFIVKKTRNYTIRHDYGFYEYTIYVYK